MAAEEILHLAPGELNNLAPAELLAAIQDLFRRWGRFGQRLTFDHQGRRYAARCDAEAFVVYRLLPPSGQGHSPPGWPVCLVTHEFHSDECHPSPGEEDYFACELGLLDWLTVIAAHLNFDRK